MDDGAIEKPTLTQDGLKEGQVGESDGNMQAVSSDLIGSTLEMDGYWFPADSRDVIRGS